MKLYEVKLWGYVPKNDLMVKLDISANSISEAIVKAEKQVNFVVVEVKAYLL